MFTALRPRFTDNIVARAEFRHQRFVINNARSGTVWIILAMALLIPAFVGSLLFFISALIAPFVSIQLLPPDLNAGLAFGAFLLLIVMNVALYAVVQLITVGLGANSILREKQGRTWETLLLTNIDARQIVLGKWWATIRALWGDQIMVALLRYGLAAWVVQTYVPAEPALRALHVLLLAGILTAFTVIDAAYSSALGILSPLYEVSGPVIATVILCARVGMTILALMWMAWLVFTLMSTGDFTYLAVGLGGLLFFGLAIWQALRVAQSVAVRGQASPPA